MEENLSVMLDLLESDWLVLSRKKENIKIVIKSFFKLKNITHLLVSCQEEKNYWYKLSTIMLIKGHFCCVKMTIQFVLYLKNLLLFLNYATFISPLIYLYLFILHSLQVFLYVCSISQVIIFSLILVQWLWHESEYQRCFSWMGSVLKTERSQVWF